MIRRRDFVALAGAAAAFPRVALAQQAKTKRIGFLMSLAEDDPQTGLYRDAIWSGLSKYGWSETNLLADYRFNANTVDAALKPAAELIALNPDVLLATSTPSITALTRLTQTIPIVFAFVTGLTLSQIPSIQSYAHPGGNVTGFSPQDDNSFFGKRLDFLRDMGVPLARVAVIYGQGAVPGGEATFLETMKAVGDKQNVQIAFYPVNTTMELIDAIAHVADAVKADPTVGLVMNGDSFMGTNRIVAAQEVTKRGLIATWSGSQTFADAGGLITYAPDSVPLYRRAGEYAGLILNGAKPADLPIQVATPLLTVNLKTAKAEGITIPASILAAADRVIE